MNPTLLKGLVALVPTSALLVGSVVVFSKWRSTGTFLQLFGAACLLVVVLTHICEALQLVPWMQWGLPSSPGHYVDLSGAILGLTLFPAGYLLHALVRRAA